METSNSPSLYFKITQYGFKCTGLWISSSDRRINIKIVIFYLTLLSTGLLEVSHKFYLTATDLSIGTEALLHASLLFHTVILYLALVWNQKYIMRMYAAVESNFYNFYKIFQKTNKYQLMEQKRSAIVTITVALVISTVHISYTYATRFYLIHLDYTEKRLFYPISLPFELNNETYYVVFAIEFVTIILDFIIHVTSISLCTGFIKLLCAEVYLLGETISDISCIDETNPKPLHVAEQTFILDADIQRNELIKLWVVHHNLLIGFYNDIQSTFGISILELLINCEVLLCLAGFQTFQMYQDHHYEQFAKNGFMLTALIVHCYVYFWYAESLHAKSINFRDHMCEGNWYNCSKKFKSSFRIILERTKRPIVFKAANIIPVTIASFIMCLKAAFSYFNLLLALKNHSPVDAS